jgi:fucose permease
LPWAALCGTYFLKYVNPGLLLTILATAAIVLLVGVIFATGIEAFGFSWPYRDV